MITKYVSQGLTVKEASSICCIAKSTYYWKSNGKKRGKRPSLNTCKHDGSIAPNSIVVDKIIEAITPDFHDYGYHMATDYLKQEGFIINKKKVYRLMNENKLLHPKIKRSQNLNKEFIKYSVPPLERPFATVETDIKYIYIHGERKNALLVTFICTFCRYATSWELSYSMKANQIADLIHEFMNDPIVKQYVNPNALNFTIRSDNGPQFIAKLLASTLGELGLKHEFIHPFTPQENGHIESFHNTVQRLVCNKYEFSDLKHARSVMKEFYYAYNYTRMMASLCSYPPVKFLKIWNLGYVGIMEKNKKQIFFLREKPTNALLVDLSAEELFSQNKYNTLVNQMSNYHEMSPVL